MKFSTQAIPLVMLVALAAPMLAEPVPKPDVHVTLEVLDGGKGVHNKEDGPESPCLAMCLAHEEDGLCPPGYVSPTPCRQHLLLDLEF